MADEGFKRKLTAILSADVEGYSRLMAEDEAATVKTLATYREVMTSLIKQHRGRVVDSPGDNILAEFSSVVDAVQCAVAVQNEIQAQNTELPDNRRMEFRIGVNLGDVIDEEDRIYGDGVNIAARLEAMADPGGICVSKTAFDQIETKLPLGYEYLGEQSVKNIPKPVKAYRVLMKPDAAGKVIGEKRFLGRFSRRTALAAIVILVVVAGGLIGWNIYLQQSKKVEPASVVNMTYPLPDKPSIAVLPFNNMSGDPEQDYIADGLTENIITGLSQISEMFVIARNSVFTYKGKPVKIKQISEELGVKYVLEGSMQKAEDRLRINAQLIDALKGHHLWSEKYDRKMEDFFSIQDDITLNIVIALQVKLTEGEQARVRHSADNLEAWALAVKAQSLFETYTRENIAKARELFKNAVELDPNYAYAWSYLGWTYYIDGVYYSAHYDRKKSFESASKMAEKALSADNKSSDAHALLSSVYLSQKKYDEAEAFGKKTIDLDPNSSENHAIVAITMQNIGKFEEAIALVKQAMRLDPYYPSWYLARLGMCYQMVGMYEKSAASFEETIKRFREKEGTAPWDRAYLHLASTYSMMGRLEEARELVSKALEFNPKMTVSLWRKRLQFKNPEHTERILESLRAVGLPD
jgi:adenylate cyclase